MNDNDIPLCVDLDGSLTPVDTLDETLLSLVRRAPAALLRLPAWLVRGKATTKDEVAQRAEVDTASLPLRTELVDWLRTERARGRRLVLATAANQRVATQIAGQLGIFDEVVASTDTVNLSGERKRQALVERFGERGFDYVGNDGKDEQVWKSARQAIVVGGPAMVARARRVAEIGREFPTPRSGPMDWIKAMRIHQWAKNGLVFLPMFLAHRFLDPDTIRDSLMAFAAFSLCASSIYIVNDLFDLSSDRQHPRKRNRPFASGRLTARGGAVAALLLFAVSLAITVQMRWKFAVVLAGYYVLTWAYSLRLKRAAMVDVMTLACLYTIRIVAGSTATGIPLSFWLLAFSVFVFLSLAFVKRYAEVYDMAQAGKNSAHGRGYRATDLPLLLNLGTASGYCMVVVMALYLDSSASQSLYTHHKPLWAICPLLLYWISRVWLLAARGEMHDDPVVFALRDRISLCVVALVAAVVLVSI